MSRLGISRSLQDVHAERKKHLRTSAICFGRTVPEVRNLRSLRSCSQSLLHCAIMCDNVQYCANWNAAYADSVQNLGSHSASLGIIVIQERKSCRQRQPLSICMPKAAESSKSDTFNLYTSLDSSSYSNQHWFSCNTKGVCIKVWLGQS